MPESTLLQDVSNPWPEVFGFQTMREEHNATINRPLARILNPIPDLRNVEEWKKSDVIHVQLLNKVVHEWNLVKDTLHDVDDGQAKQAFLEAIMLACSQLFSTEINPNVCVDSYGEFTFSHTSRAGYVDIGVRGERELSYHVRNDINPDKTAFDDCKWNLFSLPKPLSMAMEILQQEIRCQLGSCE
ncbi:MAG: hypothetical protein OXE85_14610 [Roseovarius sp.]|nr:hypothetical protein [Roseovarius sp.]